MSIIRLGARTIERPASSSSWYPADRLWALQHRTSRDRVAKKPVTKSSSTMQRKLCSLNILQISHLKSRFYAESQVAACRKCFVYNILHGYRGKLNAKQMEGVSITASTGYPQNIGSKVLNSETLLRVDSSFIFDRIRVSISFHPGANPIIN